MTQDLTEQQRKMIEKVAKLLTLAASNPNEEEAAAAHAKAQEMLIAYNLDISMVDDINNSGVRQQEELEGGKHEWQRDIWEEVARLNFCSYFNTEVFIESTLFRTYEFRRRDGKSVKVYGSWRHRHNLIGRVVNIATTRTMAQYLEQVAERLAKDACKLSGEKLTGRWANNFKTGVALRIVGKLAGRRADLLADEQRKQSEAMQAAAERAAGAVPTTQALTLAKFSEAEEEANYDFRFGSGEYRKKMDFQAEQARLDREAEEMYTRWAEANPKEARKQEQERKRAEARLKRSDDAWYKRYVNRPGFAAGYAAAKNVSIDQQADNVKPKGLLT